MTEKRFDIVIVDRIDQNIDKALDQLIKKSGTLENAQKRLDNAFKNSENAQNRLAASIKKHDGSLKKFDNTQIKAIKTANQLELQEIRIATARQSLRKATANADIAEERLSLAKKRTQKATVDVTRSEVALEKARKSVNRTSAVVISQNNQLEASNESLAASNRRVAATAGEGSRKYKAATAAARQAQAQTSNLIFQVQDIVVGLQGGQKPLTVLLQQGAQIQGAFGPGTGVIAILKGVGNAAIQMVKPFLPIVAIAGVIAGGFQVFGSEISKATGESVNFSDTLLATMQVGGEAIANFFLPTVQSIAPYFKQGYDFIIDNTGKVVNFFVGNFVGGINVIKAAWGLLQTDTASVLKLTANFTVASIEKTVNLALRILQAPVELVEKLAKIAGKDFEFDTFQIEIPKPFDLTDAEKNLQADLKAIFDEAKNKNFAGAFFDSVTIKAVENSRKRISKALTGLDKNDTSQTELLNKQAANIRALTGTYNDYGKALAIAQKRTELIVEAKKKKIKITPGVTAVINGLANAYGSAVANLERAKQVQGVIDDINGPVVNYAQSILNLTEALDKGYISQNQFNEAIGKSGLVQDLNDIKASLTNTATAYNQVISEIDQTTLIAGNIVEDAFRAGLINIDEKVKLLQELNTKASLDKNAANDNRTQGIRDFDKSLGGTFKDNAEIDQLKLDQENKIILLQQYREQKLLTEQQYDEREKALKRQTSQEIIAIENARKNAILAGAIGIGDSLASITADIAGKQSTAYRVMFAASKAFAIADSIIKIQQAISQALADPSALTLPQKIAAVGVVAAQGASIISNLNAVSGAGFRTGGFTGNGQNSAVAGVVHKNEFVVDAATTAANRPALDNLHRTGRLPSDTPNVQAPQVKQEITNKFKLVNATGVPMRMEYTDENTIRLIAEEAASNAVKDQVPKQFKNDLANPNSDISKSISAHTNAGRRLG